MMKITMVGPINHRDEGIEGKRVVIDNRNRSHDEHALGWQSLPGCENSFDGDDLK